MLIKVRPAGRSSASQMIFEGTGAGLGAARLCSLLRSSQTHRSLAAFAPPGGSHRKTEGGSPEATRRAFNKRFLLELQAKDDIEPHALVDPQLIDIVATAQHDGQLLSAFSDSRLSWPWCRLSFVFPLGFGFDWRSYVLPDGSISMRPRGGWGFP